MVVEKIIGNRKDMELSDREIDIVPMEWYELDRKLLRKDSMQGEELGIRVEERLKDGDILYMDDKKAIVLELKPCELSVMKVETMEQMGRLCFELGNRHLSLSIQPHQVSVIYDEPTFAYLEKLGFAPEKKVEKFTDFTVCHAHGHGEGHEHHHAHSDSHDHYHAQSDSHEHHHTHSGEEL